MFTAAGQETLTERGGQETLAEREATPTTRVYRAKGLFPSVVARGEPCGPGLDPVDQVTTLWTNKTGLQGGLGGKRSRLLWMSEGSMLLQLDPLDHLLTLRVRRRPSGPLL